jgi:phage terminase large subunit
MGGGHLLWLTNPVTIGGKVYEWDINPDSAANIIRIDARETPNFPESKDYTGTLIPGLATPDGVETIRRDYGEDSAEFDVRVRGRFPRQGSNAAIPLNLVEDAIARQGVTPGGSLVLGVDVARYGDDDSTACPRRGLIADDPRVFHGLPIVAKGSEPNLLDEVLLVAKELRRGSEDVNIAVDSSGLGAGLVDALLALDDSLYGWIVVIPVNAAETAHESEKYFNRRTELWFAGREWLKAGSIPGHQRLKGELIAPRYGFDPKGRQKLESKDDIKKRTKRSPDVADGFLLSLVQPPDQVTYDAKDCIRPYTSAISY